MSTCLITKSQQQMASGNIKTTKEKLDSVKDALEEILTNLSISFILLCSVKVFYRLNLVFKISNLIITAVFLINSIS